VKNDKFKKAAQQFRDIDQFLNELTDPAMRSKRMQNKIKYDFQKTIKKNLFRF
jgi:hypothetical protein